MTVVSKAPADARHVGPVRVLVRTRRNALDEILTALRVGRSMHVAFANTHLVYSALKQPHFADALRQFYVLNDGIGISTLARIAGGGGFPDNLNGTDFTPAVLTEAPQGTTLFLVGAAPGVAQRVALRIRQDFPHLSVCSVFDGYGAHGEGFDAVLEALRRERPQLVLVAMGNPLQEMWIKDAAVAAPDAVMIGVGALFDFMAGVAERAPPTWRALRLEWLFRLSREPRRLAKRYSFEVAALLFHCARERLFPQRRAVS